MENNEKAVDSILNKAIVIERWLKNCGGSHIDMDISNCAIKSTVLFEAAKSAEDIETVFEQHPEMTITSIKCMPVGLNVSFTADIGYIRNRSKLGDIWNESFRLAAPTLTVIAAALFLIMVSSICTNLISIDKTLKNIAVMGQQAESNIEKIIPSIDKVSKNFQSNNLPMLVMPGFNQRRWNLTEQKMETIKQPEKTKDAEIVPVDETNKEKDAQTNGGEEDKTNENDKASADEAVIVIPDTEQEAVE